MWVKTPDNKLVNLDNYGTLYVSTSGLAKGKNARTVLTATNGDHRLDSDLCSDGGEIALDFVWNTLGRGDGFLDLGKVGGVV